MTAPARARRTSRQISAKVPGSTHPSTSPQVARSPSQSLVLPASTLFSRASSSADDPHFWPDKSSSALPLGRAVFVAEAQSCAEDHETQTQGVPTRHREALRVSRPYDRG